MFAFRIARASFVTVVAAALAACSGGGGGSAPSVVAPAQVLQRVSGTLAIAVGSSSPASRARTPAYVSTGTTHAALFINGSATPNGTTPANGCAPSSDGSGCTIDWSATVAIPSSPTFAVEIDNGTTVLAEGSKSYALTSGSNALTSLELNGVVASAAFAITGCSSTMSCQGTVALADASDDVIVYTGAGTVPTAGTSPTTGTVFDNGAVTFATDNIVIGTVNGSAQTSGGNTYSTLTAGTLTIGGVDTTGYYTFSVACNANATGPFGLLRGGGTTPSGIVTTAELANVSVAYPASIAVTGAPSFGCTNGLIDTATGTLPVQ